MVPVVIFALLAAVAAQARLDPVHHWRTTRTPHFAIHYHEGCDELAARAARIAEEVHGRLAPRIGWTPRARTRVIIADDDDAAGGWATPYSFNQILITPTPPLGEYGFGTTRHDDWLRLVITHEYTHILQLDMASRLPLALRSVFGRLYFPNALQPAWLIEGLATYEETELTAGGRGRSPGSAMILRMAALEGPFPTLDQMAVLPDAWPDGHVPYLFGESFLRYLGERFGREKLAEISRAYGGRPLPFLVESTGLATLGEAYADLWRQWREELRSRAQEQQRALTARGLTPSAPLTNAGRFNGSPAWSPDGRRIAWLRADGSGFPGVWVMDADGSNGRRLVRNSFSTTTAATMLSWSAEGGRLYYTKQGIVRGAAVVNDIWAWDFGRQREIRITRGLRARDAHPSPDGRTLVLVTAARGLTRLALLDLDGQLPAQTAARLRPLTGLSTDQYAEPRWSPDGRRIAASVWVPGGEKELRVLDRAGRLLASVGHESALDGAPAWSADGRSLIFSSDATGIYNIFRWDEETGRITQLTNVLGGAFSPAPSPDGRRLAFADYSAKGYDIRVMNLEESAGRRGGAEGRSPAGERSEAIEEVPAELLRHAIRSHAERDHEPPEQGTSLGEEANGRVDGGPQRPPQRRGGRQDPAARTITPAASTAYSPLDTILPRLWFPWAAYSPASGTLAGLITGGQDVLQRHRYTFTGLYGPESGRLMHWLDYTYAGLRPTVSLTSSDIDRTHGGLLKRGRASADYSERLRTLGADIGLDFPGLDSSRAIALGYRYRELTALSPLPPSPGDDDVLPATGQLGSTRLAWSSSDAHRWPLTVSPSEGRRVDLRLEHFQKGFGSTRTFTQTTLDWNEYFALPAPRHVLAARLLVGSVSGGPPQQGIFSLGGSTAGEIDTAPDDLTLRLRGYAPNRFRGERALLTSLEYRFPLLEVGRGGVSAPFFLRRIHGALFVDAGEAWSAGAFRTGELHAGIGAEIRLDLYFSYVFPLSVRLGIAAGLDAEGGVYPTLGIWIPQGLLGPSASRQR